MAEVVRADALHRQVANIVREAITSGEYPPGTQLPSEDALAKRHGVSRPTIRLALNTLRAEGLISVRMGKGSTVRPGPDAEATTIWRTADTGPDRLTDTSEPERYRRNAGTRMAALLDIPADEPMFVQDATGTDPGTGRTVLTRRMLPFTVAEGTPLETEPFPDRPALLAILAKAHGKLTVAEYVRPLMPQPDESATLDLIDGTPILETTRITSADGRPVLAETERTSGDGTQNGYRMS
jgi:GntR family transcriptional regulator